MNDAQFINSLEINNIPWHRLLTVYGRATEFPNYVYKLYSHNKKEREKALKDIDLMLIHQESVMPVVPFALIFLYKTLEKNNEVLPIIKGIKSSVEYQFYLAKYTGNGLTTSPLPIPALLLDENLLPEFISEEIDETLIANYDFGIAYESTIVQAQAIIDYFKN